MELGFRIHTDYRRTGCRSSYELRGFELLYSLDRTMKPICKLSKRDLADLLPEICQIEQLKYVCKKCGRLAPQENRLCKPLKIAKFTHSSSKNEPS